MTAHASALRQRFEEHDRNVREHKKTLRETRSALQREARAKARVKRQLEALGIEVVERQA